MTVKKTGNSITLRELSSILNLFHACNTNFIYFNITFKIIKDTLKRSVVAATKDSVYNLNVLNNQMTIYKNKSILGGINFI